MNKGMGMLNINRQNNMINSKSEEIKEHRAQIPQQRHKILGSNSTGHRTYSASEALKK